MGHAAANRHGVAKGGPLAESARARPPAGPVEQIEPRWRRYGELNICLNATAADKPTSTMSESQPNTRTRYPGDGRSTIP